MSMVVKVRIFNGGWLLEPEGSVLVMAGRGFFDEDSGPEEGDYIVREPADDEGELGSYRCHMLRRVLRGEEAHRAGLRWGFCMFFLSQDVGGLVRERVREVLARGELLSQVFLLHLESGQADFIGAGKEPAGVSCSSESGSEKARRVNGSGRAAREARQ